GAATGFTLSDQIYVKRGELAVLAEEAKPQTTSRLRCNLFWLGKKPLVPDKPYILKLGTAKVKMRLEMISRVLDAASLETMTKQEVARYEVAEGTLRLEEAIAFDRAVDNATTGRFVIVDDDEIAGGGIVIEALTDEQEMIREEVIRRNYKWEKSSIGPEERAAQYGQQTALIVLTGAKDTGKKPLAKALERQLFNEGKAVYFMGIGNVLYGVDADLKKNEQDRREEHLRRLAEIAHLMLDAGLILLITALDLTQAEFENFKAIVENKNVVSIWVGDQVTTDLNTDLRIPGNYQVMDATTVIHHHLEKLQII
ncbi:MAG TPA: adenylyl-sulfate kinase, partial [Bacillota bacterium]|nr:adenylyl-sulfate kinase [Bacillota bacterium]